MRPGSSRIVCVAVIVMAIAQTSPCHAQSGQTADAIVEQPRAFGHVLGDVLTQRVLLSVDGRALHDVPMPSAGRIGVWLERRPPRIEQDAQGRAWMVIDYQIVNAAQTLTQADVPAFELKPAGGKALHVAAWPVSIGPLTPRTSFRAGDLQALRPDRIVTPPDQTKTQRHLMAMLALMFLVLLSWAAWWSWRKHQDARKLPFARAWRAIRKLDKHDTNDGPDIDVNDNAWVHVHRALDEAAGQTVHAASLHALLVRAPYLEALQSGLEAFYASSQQRFFARDTAAAPFALRAFAHALYRAERTR